MRILLGSIQKKSTSVEVDFFSLLDEDEVHICHILEVGEEAFSLVLGEVALLEDEECILVENDVEINSFDEEGAFIVMNGEVFAPWGDLLDGDGSEIDGAPFGKAESEAVEEELCAIFKGEVSAISGATIEDGTDH